MSLDGGDGTSATSDNSGDWEIVNAVDVVAQSVQPDAGSSVPSNRVFREVMSKLPRRFKGALQLAWIYWRKRQFELSGPVLSWTSVDKGGKGTRKKHTQRRGDEPADADSRRNTFVLCEDTLVQLERGFGDKVITIMSPRAGVLHIMCKTKALASRWVELLSAAVPLKNRSPHLSIGATGQMELTVPPESLLGDDHNEAEGTSGWECDLCGEKSALSEEECPLCGSARPTNVGGPRLPVPAGAGGASVDRSRTGSGGGGAMSPVSRCRRQLSQNTAARVEQAFTKLDHNKDGTIGTKDIRPLINDLALPSEILDLLFELRVHEFLADELDQNKDGRILKSDLVDYALKLKQDESFSSRTESSLSLVSDLLDTSSQSYSNCKDLVRFNFEWEKYCRTRDAALEQTLRSCTVEDFQIEEELGRGSAGQLWRVRLLRRSTPGSTAEELRQSGGGKAAGDQLQTKTVEGEETEEAAKAGMSGEVSTLSRDNISVALKKIWDLNGGAGPSATEFEAEQRKDYTVPLRYPHPYLVRIYNFLEDQPTLLPSTIEQQTGSGRTSYVLMELCGDNLAIHFERQRQAGDPDEKQVLVVLLQVCTVLAHLAAVGVAHRDLKLDNLTLAAAASTLPDEVRVIDFGCSVVHDDLVGDPAVNTEAIPKAVAVSDTSARQQDPSAQSDVASATGDEVLDTHHKFLKKRRSSSLLVGNQQNWAPELWTLARQQQHVQHPTAVSMSTLDEDSVDPYKLDVWSVGCLPFAMLGLPHPYVGRDGPVEQEESEKRQRAIPLHYKRIQKFVDFVLIRDPADRPTMADAVKLLQELIWNPPKNHKEQVRWLFSRCSEIVERMRRDGWLHKVESQPQDVQWRTIVEKLELEFIADAFKRELSQIILMR